MASGFPTGAYCSKASQTPMSFCAASSVSTCTRTRKGMFSIVLRGFLVSMGGWMMFVITLLFSPETKGKELVAQITLLQAAE